MKLIPYKDILLVKNSKSLWALAIKLFLRDEYGYVHCEYVVDNWLTVGTDLLRPVNVHTFGYNLKDIDIYRYVYDLTKKQEEILVESIQKLTRRKYDILEAIFLGFNIKNEAYPNNYICISLITKAMESAGMLPAGLSKKYRGFEVFTKSGYFIKA